PDLGSLSEPPPLALGLDVDVPGLAQCLREVGCELRPGRRDERNEHRAAKERPGSHAPTLAAPPDRRKAGEALTAGANAGSVGGSSTTEGGHSMRTRLTM